MRNYRELLVMVAWSALLSFAACANITVNIYFPEKDVKSAYKSLEEELLQTPKKEQQETPAHPPVVQHAATTAITAGCGPRVANDAGHRRDGPGGSCAADYRRDQGLSGSDRRYKGIGQRLARMNQLRDQGLVGEAKDGKAVLRANPPQAGDAETVLREENSDREVVINGMAKAILKLTQQQGTPANLARVKTQASETFASIRREAAHPGWWVQQPNGAWTRK